MGGEARGSATVSTLQRSPPTYRFLTCVNPTGELISPCQHF
jgi:hypothetical protein